MSNGKPIIGPKVQPQSLNQTQNSAKENNNINNELKETQNNLNERNNNFKTNEKSILPTNEENLIPTVFVSAPFFMNPINKTPKGFYNKFPRKKTKTFAERTGDWICKSCQNLNFAFRLECNRCKMPKKDAIEIVDPKDMMEKNKNTISNNNNNCCNNDKNNRYKYKKHYSFNTCGIEGKKFNNKINKVIESDKSTKDNSKDSKDEEIS